VKKKTRLDPTKTSYFKGYNLRHASLNIEEHVEAQYYLSKIERAESS